MSVSFKLKKSWSHPQTLLGTWYAQSVVVEGEGRTWVNQNLAGVGPLFFKWGLNVLGLRTPDCFCTTQSSFTFKLLRIVQNLGSHCVLWFQPFYSSSFLHHNLFGSIYDYFILFPFLRISLLHTAPHFFGVLYPRVFVDFVGHGVGLITCHSPFVSRDFQRNILAWDDGSRPLTPPKVREVRWNGGTYVGKLEKHPSKKLEHLEPSCPLLSKNRSCACKSGVKLVMD